MSFNIIIKTKGLAGLPQKIKKMRINVLAALPLMLARAGEQVRGQAVEKHLSGPRPKNLGRVSGDLARSIGYKVTGNKVAVGTNLIYARIHEYGGVIVPRQAKALHFKLRDGGWRTASKVVMPERSFLRSSLRESRGAIKSIVQALAEKALREALA